MPGGRHRAIGSISTDPTTVFSASAEQLSKRAQGSSFARNLERSQLKGRSIKDFTQDWINHYLSGKPRTERTNWLSDDESGESEVASYLTAKNHLSEDSDGWLGLGDDPVATEDPLRTPTSATFLKRSVKGKEKRRPARHMPQESTDTLKQSDFWDFGYDPDAMPTTMADLEASTPTQKEAPAETTQQESQQTLPPAKDDAATPKPASPPVTAEPAAKRPRKKVSWRGKQCTIALPLDDRRGQPELGGPLLTPADVEQIFDKWKDDIRAFEEIAAASQSVPSFPDPSDSKREWEQKDFAIRFPNKAEWDAYVNRLNEEKLRALGVFLGDDEPEPSPAQSHAQLPGVSPPMPTSSVNSNPMGAVPNAFSPAFSQATQQGAGLASLTSPASPFGMVNSPFGNPQLPFSNDQSGFPFVPFQPTPPIQSFTPHNFYTSRQGGVSPLTVATLPGMTSLLGPVSPLTTEDTTKHFPVAPTPVPVHGAHPLSNEFQPSNYDDDDDGELRDADFGIEPDTETIMSNSVPQMAHPTPRGGRSHRHNLSETLQKGVDAGEYEIDEGHDFMGSGWGVPEEDGRGHGQFHPDPKSQTQHLQRLFGEQQQQRMNGLDPDEGDDIDTNPSLTGASPRPDMAGFHHHQHQHQLPSHKPHDSTHSFGHKSRTSLSGLNVEAKAFDPSAQFAANNNFSFMNDALRAQAQPFAFNPGASVQPFTAGQNQSQNQQQNNETGKFKFSASTFNVDAPVFNPSGMNFKFGGNTTTTTAPAASAEPKIFSNFEAPPAKKSKAIPIVKPDDKKSNTGDTENRETQGPAKRSRHGTGDDGEQEAVFVQPEHTLRSVPDVDGKDEIKGADEDEANDSERSTVPAESVKGEDEKAWKPFVFRNSEDAAAFNAAHPASPPPGEKRPTPQPQPQPEKPVVKTGPSPDKELPPLPDKDSGPSRPQSKGFSLKPTAKPFELNPAINVQPLPAAEDKANDEQPTTKKPAGLMASKYAVVSPPASPIADKPLPAPPVHDETEKDGDHDSLDEQELDAVMKQLNKDDTDVGVERQVQTPRRIVKNPSDLRASSPSVDVDVEVDAEAEIEEAQVQTARVIRGMPRLTVDHDGSEAISPRHAPFDPDSPVRNINNPALDSHISDWDDDFSAQEIELRHKTAFFDTHVNDIIGSILDDRLIPFERSLNLIQRSVGLLTSGSPSPLRRANLVEHSDADDEDDGEVEDGGEFVARSVTEHRERRLEKIKQAVMEALAAREVAVTPSQVPTPAVDLSGVQSALAELKDLAASKGQEDQAEELKVVIAELKQLAVMNAAMDQGRDQKSIMSDAVAELKAFVKENIVDGEMWGVVQRLRELVLAKEEQRESEKQELRGAVEQLKQLVLLKAEQEEGKESELQDTVAQLKQLVIMKAEQDKGSELHEAIVELKKMAARRAEEDSAAELQDAIAQFKQLIVMKAEQDRRSELDEVVGELRALVEEKKKDDETMRVKEMLAEVIASHPKFNEERDSAALDEEAEKFQLQIDGMQSMIRLADERADDEYNARRRAQDALAESQRRLKIAEEEAQQAREEAAALKEQFDAFKLSQTPDIERAEEDKKAQQNLTLALSELSDKNLALETTLDSYKVACNRATNEAEESKAENMELRRTIHMLKEQLETGLQSRQGLREKFDRLQEDMIRATEAIARDQSAWRKKEEEHIIKYNALQAQYEMEAKARKKLEMHVEELEVKEKEALKLKYILRQSQDENAKLEELLMNVRQESHDYQNQAARFEREFNEARESSRVEIQRVRNLMEADLETANHQVNFVRAELEAQLVKLENHLENSKMKADTEAARHELLLDEAKESKAAALKDAAEAREAALQEQRLVHERAMNDLRERHARALLNASEDRARDESHYMELLALRDEKIEQLQDKIMLVEEKLELAKSAARAAAQAAQSATKNNTPPAQPTVTSPSMTFAKGADVPERISPQALRESIMVLQDQLQQREARIEELEHEISTFDKDAPNKIKEKETEITWLRELLGVRIDDLQDIINILSQPSFNQQAVRDAAIRLKANLQMQQQERERAMAGGTQPFPSLASLSNFAASPRALPLAAAAAWGSWRKGRDQNSSSRPNEQTPSKAPTTSSAQGFLSGLMTPPSSNTRQSNQSQSGPSQQRQGGSRPLRSSSSVSHQQRGMSIRQMGKMPLMEPPSTPPLLRKSSYDHDAEAADYQYDERAYADDNDGDNDSVLGGIVSRDTSAMVPDGPFGPAI